MLSITELVTSICSALQRCSLPGACSTDVLRFCKEIVATCDKFLDLYAAELGEAEAAVHFEEQQVAQLPGQLPGQPSGHTWSTLDGTWSTLDTI